MNHQILFDQETDELKGQIVKMGEIVRPTDRASSVPPWPTR